MCYVNSTLAISQCNKQCPGYGLHCMSIDWKSVNHGCCDRPIFYNCKIRLSMVLPPVEGTISLLQVCDGYKDCAGNEDELNCSDRFYCSNYNQTIHVSQICDGFSDCTNNLDEANCSNMFYCGSDNQTIHISKVCDLRLWT